MDGAAFRVLVSLRVSAKGRARARANIGKVNSTRPICGPTLSMGIGATCTMVGVLLLVPGAELKLAATATNLSPNQQAEW